MIEVISEVKVYEISAFKIIEIVDEFDNQGLIESIDEVLGLLDRLYDE